MGMGDKQYQFVVDNLFKSSDSAAPTPPASPSADEGWLKLLDKEREIGDSYKRMYESLKTDNARLRERLAQQNKERI
jgi:hypothetical protein